MADNRRDTFRTYTDQNGVKTSCNAHSEQDYEHPPSQQLPGATHWMIGPSGPYVEQATQSLVHSTKDQVLFRLGSRHNAMTFDSLLKPRGEEDAAETKQASAQNSSRKGSY